MKRIILLLFACLCMQYSVAQTDTSPSSEKSRTKSKLYLNEQQNKLEQTLPQWFVTPKEDEYMGCSFPSEYSSSRHETAIVSAILNFIISNKDFNTILLEDASSRSDDSFNALSKRLFSLPIHIQVVRLEAIGKDTFVAIKVDTIDNKERNYLSFNYKFGMYTTDRSKMENSMIELNFGKEGKYQIIEKTIDSQISLAFSGQKSFIVEDILGKAVDNYNNTAIKDNGKIVAEKIPSFDRYGSPDNGVNCGFVFWQALIRELKQKMFNTEYMFEGTGCLPAQHFRNTKNEMVNGKLFVIFKPIKK